MHETPLSIAEVAREVQHLAVSLHPPIRGAVRLDTSSVSHSGTPRSRTDCLLSGSYSVTEVCLEIGFSSLGSFSDLFTRRVGEPLPPINVGCA